MANIAQEKPSLTTQEIDLLRRSFLILGVENAFAGELFYKHLFSDRAELEKMFVTEIASQSEKLTNMLGMIVSQLHNMPGLLSLVTDLAQRHVVYGVKAEHYRFVGEALLKTLGEVLGAEFSSSVEDAWVKAYDGIAVAMVESCYGPAGVLQYRGAQ